MQPGGPVIERLLEGCRGNATISIDPNVRSLFVDLDAYRSRLQRWCELADVIRLSLEDLNGLLPGASVDQAFSTWHQAGVPLIIITLGAEGVIASFNGERVSTSAVHVPVIDTIGAGDAFTGGVLHWLHAAGGLGGRLDHLRRDDLEAALAFGTHVAAITCTVPGADPPHSSELTEAARALLPRSAG
jgi:fructokinase